MTAVLPTPAPSMRGSLTLLLDSVPRSRKVFRHLAAVERGLKHMDNAGQFLFDVSLDNLTLMLQQLDTLLDDPAPSMLLALRGKIAAAMRLQQHAETMFAQSQPISSFFVEHKMQVEEVDHAEFERLSADWMR